MRVLEECNIEYTQYADDLIIISSYNYISRNSLRFISNLIKNLGFKTNLNKTQRMRKNKIEILGLLLINDNNYGGYGLYPRERQKIKHNIRLWNYLENKTFTNSRRLNKLGQPIQIDCIRKGLENWLTQCQHNSQALGLLSYTIL